MKSMIPRTWMSAESLLALALVLPAGLCGQAGLTTTGRATVNCPVDHLAVRVVVSGKAESAADARMKYESMRERFVSAVDAKKLLNSSTEGTPPVVETIVPGANQNQFRIGGQPADPADQEYSVTETITVKIGKISEVSRTDRLKLVAQVLECVTESGAELFGTFKANNVFQSRPSVAGSRSQTAVSLEYADPKPLEDAAMEAAIADAKVRAARMAEIAGVALGRIKGISSRPGNVEWKWGDDAATYQMEVTVNFDLQ